MQLFKKILEAITSKQQLAVASNTLNKQQAKQLTSVGATIFDYQNN